MSVILYSKQSYVRLSENFLFRGACRHLDWNSDEFAEDLFRLNAASFRYRYSHWENIDAEIADAEVVGYVDSEFDNHLSKPSIAKLYRLIKRIEYQCCEFDPDDCDMASLYNRLQYLKERVADQVCDELDRQLSIRRVA